MVTVVTMVTMVTVKLMVKSNHCGHDLARPLVADEGPGLHMWRAAVSILNKPSWTAEKRWSSSLGVLARG